MHAQNPLQTFPRNFPVDGEVANFLRSCCGLVKACPHCGRKVRLSANSATVTVVSPFSATLALFCDSVDRALATRPTSPQQVHSKFENKSL